MNPLRNGQMKSGQPIGVNKYFYCLVPGNKAPIWGSGVADIDMSQNINTSGAGVAGRTTVRVA